MSHNVSDCSCPGGGLSSCELIRETIKAQQRKCHREGGPDAWRLVTDVVQSSKQPCKVSIVEKCVAGVTHPRSHDRQMKQTEFEAADTSTSKSLFVLFDLFDVCHQPNGAQGDMIPPARPYPLRLPKPRHLMGAKH